MSQFKQFFLYIQVKWVDPSEDEERQKLEAKLAKETQALGVLGQATAGFDSMGTMELPTNLTEAMMEEGDCNKAPGMHSGSRLNLERAFFFEGLRVCGLVHFTLLPGCFSLLKGLFRPGSAVSLLAEDVSSSSGENNSGFGHIQ